MAVGKDRAILVRHREGQPNSDTPYRATAFWPAQDENGTWHLYPFLRARLGAHVEECTSRLYFDKGEKADAAGDAFAGTAWTRPGAVISPPLPVVGDKVAGSDVVLDEHSWRLLLKEKYGVPGRITDAIGKDSSYARRVRAIACARVSTSWGGIIVFSIESIWADGFDKTSFTPKAIDDYALSDGPNPKDPITTILCRVIPMPRSFGV